MKIIDGDDYRIFRIGLRLTEDEEYLGYRIDRAELLVRVDNTGERHMEALTAHGRRKISHNRWTVNSRLDLGNLAYIIEAYLLNCMGEAMIADDRLREWASAKCVADFGKKFKERPAAERAFIFEQNYKLAEAEYEKVATWLNGIESMEEADVAKLQADQQH